MSSLIGPYFLAAGMFAAVIGCLAAFRGFLLYWSEKPTRLSHLENFSSIAPSLLLLGLFYTLAWHVHRSLGVWPASIDERGFSPGLSIHVRMTGIYWGAMMLLTLFVWPVAFSVCGLYRPWRRWTTYLIIHILSFVLCTLLMLMAPAPFLDWWID